MAKRSLVGVVGGALLLSGLAPAATLRAQDGETQLAQTATSNPQDAGARSDTEAAKMPAGPRAAVRTARLSFFSGEVQVQRSDNTAPEAGQDSVALNMPLPEGTRVAAGVDGQAEIEFEDGSVARLTPKSSLAIDALSLDAKSVAHTQLSLLHGLAYFELRHSAVATYRIQAGDVTADPTTNAVLRVALDAPPATFAVISGSVETEHAAAPEDENPGFHAEVRAGESLRADPDDASRYFLNQQVATEDWDTWSQSRDQLALADAGSQTSARDGFAGTQGYGWSDLDANGTWYTMPGADGSQTELWQPASAALTDSGDSGDGFDPYGDGAYLWSGGGYLWASGYGWGWLPYRCGRWDWYPGFGWAWRPNRFCSVWGFGGGGGGILGHRPPRYKVVGVPVPGPGGIHPILRVHNQGPPRAAPVHEQPVKIAGVIATPLAPAGETAFVGGTLAGGTLYRDYPIETGTRMPVLGTIAAPVASDRELPLSGWVGRQSVPRPVAGGVAAGRPGAGPPAAQNEHHVSAAPVRIEPARPAPAAQHSAPAAPAPASSSKPK